MFLILLHPPIPTDAAPPRWSWESNWQPCSPRALGPQTPFRVVRQLLVFLRKKPASPENIKCTPRCLRRRTAAMQVADGRCSRNSLPRHRQQSIFRQDSPVRPGVGGGGGEKLSFLHKSYLSPPPLLKKKKRRTCNPKAASHTAVVMATEFYGIHTVIWVNYFQRCNLRTLMRKRSLYLKTHPPPNSSAFIVSCLRHQNTPAPPTHLPHATHTNRDTHHEAKTRSPRTTGITL